MLTAFAPAKINWSLDILGTREDGYHLMDMLMQTISLHDTLTYTLSDTISLRFSNSNISLPTNDNNLIIKAAKLLQQQCKVSKGVHITLDKCIPSGAGLGGGSADAACTLIALNKLWNLQLPMPTLHAYALQLGADVPFLLEGGLGRVLGIGEQITPLFPAPLYHLVILQPCDGLSTQEVFKAYDKLPAQETIPMQLVQTALLDYDFNQLATYMHNVLAVVSLAKRPAMALALDNLNKQGACIAIMTGSGSCVYGVFKNEHAAKNAYEKLSTTYEKCYLTHTINNGITLNSINI